MSTSKFNELEEILSKDYEETDEYLKRNCEFIQQLTQKLSDYLGCGLWNLFCYTLEDKPRSLAEDKIQDLIYDDSIKVTNDCYFIFPVLIKIKPSLTDKNIKLTTLEPINRALQNAKKWKKMGCLY